MANRNGVATCRTSKIEQIEFIDQFDVVPKVRRYLDDGLNTVLAGPAGIGKTTLVHELAGGAQNVVTAIGSKMLPGDLIGRMTLQNDSTVWKEGLLVKALRQGLTFYADELTGFSDDCLRILHSVIDFRRELFVTANSEIVKAHPNFRFIASCNLSPTGIDPLTREFRDRLVYVYMNRLDSKTEAKLLVDRYHVTLDDAEFLVLYANVTRNVDPKNGASTRQLEAAARAIRVGVDRQDAADDCILSSIVGNSLAQRESMVNAIRAEGLYLHQKSDQRSSKIEDSIVVTEDEEIWS